DEFSGCSAPRDTGTPSTRHRSSRPRLFSQTWSTATFPPVDAMPTTSASGLASRDTNASASSTPVSTSTKAGAIAPPLVPLPGNYAGTVPKPPEDDLTPHFDDVQAHYDLSDDFFRL